MSKFIIILQLWTFQIHILLNHWIILAKSKPTLVAKKSPSTPWSTERNNMFFSGQIIATGLLQIVVRRKGIPPKMPLNFWTRNGSCVLRTGSRAWITSSFFRTGENIPVMSSEVGWMGFSTDPVDGGVQGCLFASWTWICWKILKQIGFKWGKLQKTHFVWLRICLVDWLFSRTWGFRSASPKLGSIKGALLIKKTPEVLVVIFVAEGFKKQVKWCFWGRGVRSTVHFIY